MLSIHISVDRHDSRRVMGPYEEIDTTAMLGPHVGHQVLHAVRHVTNAFIRHCSVP